MPTAPSGTGAPPPSPADVRRWRRYLAEERAEAALYTRLAAKRQGEEREILFALAEAEGRHAAHWVGLLGDDVGRPLRPSVRSRLLIRLAGRFGSVFVLALAQRAEARSAYADDEHATAAMAADERIHEEVVRSLAERGRARMSGTFRAAVFGMNDGLVSNLALVLGIGASGVDNATIMLTGIAGLLAGALSMGAGEFVSVRSQRELLEASNPSPTAHTALPDLDVNANELALVYRARGMPESEARAKAEERIATYSGDRSSDRSDARDHEEIGSAWGAALSSFCFFASGAIIPVLPYLFGLTGLAAVVVAAGLVGIALMLTGATVGILSGAAPLSRALRQLAIGWGAAAATYVLGLLFGTTVG
ncbi:VIT1/CCC1 transporter family protein [Occultella gossypii]|uniref:VIT1/CCC1 transporter family protein n=1 Tax=Occultella gossypii TaxID=2800820 RepID=A0ABS7SH68_9MICO|nr:VIT1/CCC1 family protein [Occultella gossypii]MBZ2199407.1 VIT1/CCC1 transporter family protein [Occultella gossypii]